MASLVKRPCLAFSGQNSNYEAVVTREEKRMVCSNKACGAWCTTHFLWVFFYKWTRKHHWSMTSLDACLVFYFCSHQQFCQFVLYLWTDLVHKNKRFQEMAPCLAVPCGNFKGKNSSIISIPPCLQISSSKNHHPASPQNFKIPSMIWFGYCLEMKNVMNVNTMYSVFVITSSSHEIWACPGNTATLLVWPNRQNIFGPLVTVLTGFHCGSY